MLEERREKREREREIQRNKTMLQDGGLVYAMCVCVHVCVCVYVCVYVCDCGRGFVYVYVCDCGRGFFQMQSRLDARIGDAKRKARRVGNVWNKCACCKHCAHMDAINRWTEGKQLFFKWRTPPVQPNSLVVSPLPSSITK